MNANYFTYDEIRERMKEMIGPGRRFATQADMAEHLGILPSAISMILKGHLGISETVAERLGLGREIVYFDIAPPTGGDPQPEAEG